MKDSKEKLATYLGWISFAVTFIGLFLPWGTYEYFSGLGQRIYFVSGLATNYGFLLIIGTLAIVAGLLSSMVKPSSASIAFLGTGALATVIIAGWFLSNYYGQGLYSVYPQIQNISIGSFVTLTGGILTLAAAILYSLHFRTPSNVDKTQASTPVS